MDSTFSKQEGRSREPDELHQIRDAEDARGVSAQPAYQPLQDAARRRRGGLCRQHLTLPRLRAPPAARHESVFQLHLKGESSYSLVRGTMKYLFETQPLKLVELEFLNKNAIPGNGRW